MEQYTQTFIIIKTTKPSHTGKLKHNPYCELLPKKIINNTV